MSTTTVSTPARERVLHAALQCFTAKGYAATTIVDIEMAAGLTPRCGGTYRHFASKKAILEAAIERMLEDSETAISPEVRSPEQAAADALALLDRHRDARRLLFQDLEEFPELKSKVADRLIGRSFGIAADAAAEYAPDADTEAMAVVMVASLSGFRMVQAMLGHPPLGVSDDRFVATWAKAFVGLIEGALREEPDAPNEGNSDAP